ncbi:hypothetical protein [Brevundimonas intermedia]|uniref:hypothetical protein n=1 Tax=Brevundimonas intermedia TaxID=74315 RepID=UPI00320A24AF
MNILVLAAGDTRNGDSKAYPIWLEESDGILMIERQAQALCLREEVRFIYAFRSIDIANFHVDDIVNQIVPNVSVIEIRRDTSGAACTALLAVDQVDMDAELIVTSATDFSAVDYDAVLSSFRKAGADVGVLSFESLHPRYSYLRLREERWVEEAAEKRPISRHANAGFYWYAQAGDFFSSLQTMIAKDVQTDGVFYISPSLNELVLLGRKIMAWKLKGDEYRPLKDQRQVNTFSQAWDVRDRNAA